MSWVADASWTAALFLPDECSSGIDERLAELQDGVLLVPQLWWYETTNILCSAERRGRISVDQIGRIFLLIGALPLETDERIAVLIARRIYDIAATTGVSAYDAAYLELALRRRRPLATLDAESARAAQTLGVTVIGAAA